MEDRAYEQKEFVSCAKKLRHKNYWIALQHISSLSKEYPLAHLHIYECLFCGGLHVSTGKSHKDYFGLKTSLNHLEAQIANPGYERAPKEVRTRHAQLVVDLKARITVLETMYYKKKNKI